MADITTVMDRDAVVDFSDPSIYHDRILIVGEEKFHVLSQFLSMWSEHFCRMFEGDFAEANKKEIEIKEVHPEMFKKYLTVIYKGSCEMKENDIIPLIDLSYRFLTPHVVEFCAKYINGRLNLVNSYNIYNLDSVKIELLRTACFYNNKKLKKTLFDHFMNDKVMSNCKVSEVVDIVVEYDVKEMKAWLGDYMSKNLTVDNCSDLLDSSVKFNMPTLKVGIVEKIKKGGYSSVKKDQIIGLMKAAFKHNVQDLKDQLRRSIERLSHPAQHNTHAEIGPHFVEYYYDQIKILPDDVKDFIILSSFANNRYIKMPNY